MNDLKKNGSGYEDPTAYKAIKSTEIPREERRKFDYFLKALFALCRGFGYHLENRIVVRDEENGRRWK